MKTLERIAKIAAAEWREFLEVYSAVSDVIAMKITPEGVITSNLSRDSTALVRLVYKAHLPVEPVSVCLEAKPLLKGVAEATQCEFEDFVPQLTPTARARLSAEKLRLWITEAERIEAEHAVFEAAGGRLRFFASACYGDCYVEDYAEAEGEANAMYSLRYLKAVKRISKPAVLEFATDNPLHMMWETPRVTFSLYLASLPRD